jgi:sialate O-acetylesterase
VIEQPLVGAKIENGPEPWQILQRDPDGKASVNLEGTWWAERPSVVEACVASEYDGSSAPGCDWQAAEMLDGNKWRATLRPPTGGPYNIETRLCVAGEYWRQNGDRIWHVSVGDIWVIAGQSNAVGFGHGAVVDPPALGVSVFAANDEWRLATHPIFDSTDTKHVASRDSGWVDVSPWLAFGKEIFRQAGVPIGLIPAALGGSPLRIWDPGNGAEAVLYDNMVDMIEAAGGRVAGMVWYQGCSDTDCPDRASSYLERFTRFVQTFRARYGADLPVITVQLNRFYDCLPQNELGWSVLREAQRQAAKVIPNVAVIPSLDLGLSDVIHTGAPGNVILGQRFAATALGMVYGNGDDWRAADVRDIKFVDAERKSVRVSFDPGSVPMMMLGPRPGDFVLEDVRGVIQVAVGRVEEQRDVVLELERPAEGRTVCHNMPGSDPCSTLRDRRQWPVLAFHGVEVLG